MLKQEIKIAAIGRDEDEIEYRITLRNGISSTSLDFYGYEDEFKTFGEKLITFPQSIEDVVVYELGEDDPKWAYYMKLKVFCYDPNGYSAIQVIVDNHKESVNKTLCKFYIKTVPAALNKLGGILKKWNPISEDEIQWNAE